LGILSDTHGKFDITVRAVAQLQAAGAEHLVHCGDVGNIRVLEALCVLPAAFVFGNNDWEHDEYRRAADLLEIRCLAQYGELLLAGKRIAVTHGDDDALLRRLTKPGNSIDYLLTGHTHRRHDQNTAGPRWINPGALFRAPIKTVAILDLVSDELSYLEVSEV
jgi:hypothetical protein